MATINYVFRSNKEKAPLTARLSFKIDGKSFQIWAKTKIEVTKEYWKKDYNRKNWGNVDIKRYNYHKDIISKTVALNNFILSEFSIIPESEIIDSVNTIWLKSKINLSEGNEVKEELKTPESLIKYVDYYIKLKEKDSKEGLKKSLGAAAAKKYKVLKNKLCRFENYIGKKMYFNNIDTELLNEFIRYARIEKYNDSTTAKDIKMIKTLCFSAESQGIEIDKSINRYSLNKQIESNIIYFTSSEIESIENLHELPEYLENAKDWLLISIYTGQRVSDLLRFDSDSIIKRVNKNGVEVWSIIITQKKTGADVKIILNDCIHILKKRNGNFPRSLSDQKYNDFIKEVAKRAGIDTITKGGIKNPKTNRKEFGDFPKWMLVSTHIGRRTFASHKYGKMDLRWLMSQTGHTTEQSLKAYIGKKHSDYAEEYEDSILS
ncbi:MAG: site-specific integrase [Bacteroidetes bacterium]|nr:site-specific integrase [Bacteroidota bacterium]